MRVNCYAEEMTDRIEIVEKEINGQKFTGLRMYLYLPVTRVDYVDDGRPNFLSPGKKVIYNQTIGPFLHGEGDDDSSAVTFWGKKDLRIVLQKALLMLDAYYDGQKMFTRVE